MRTSIALSLFVIAAPVAGAQVQVAKLIASDISQGDRFGWRVSIWGDWALIGSPYDDDIADQSGAAYIYHRAGNSWVEYQKLKAADAASGDQFGSAVALSGGTAVVGAPSGSPQGLSGAGSAYVFELVGGTWVQTAKIWASDAAPSEHFGTAAAASSTRVLIGDNEDTIPAGVRAGSAYVFEKSGSTWAQTAKLTASDGASGDRFGLCVSLEGDLACIGANGVDDPMGIDVGAAYVFAYSLGAWTQTAKLLADNRVASDYVGPVAIAPGVIVVGAVGRDAAGSSSGAAYVFEYQAGVWVQTQELVPLDADASDQFGGSLALSGELLLVSAATDRDLGPSSGSAYAFKRGASGWTEIGKLLARDGSKVFGMSVGLSGTTAIAGAWADRQGCPVGSQFCLFGAAYVHELAPDAVQYGSCASGAPCGNVDTHGGCRNSTGHGAILAAGGSSSVSFDDLVLEATHLPPSQNAIVFMGTAQLQVPLGDGLRVIGGAGSPLFRYSIQQADAQGLLLRGPGLASTSQNFALFGRISTGQTWNFQCWYRDPSGPCAHTTNLSNGVQVLFTP